MSYIIVLIIVYYVVLIMQNFEVFILEYLFGLYIALLKGQMEI